MRQHFLPVFMLNQWSDTTQRVASFRRRDAGLRARHFHPRGVGYAEDLWAFNRDEVAGWDRQHLETRVFQPLDNQAARLRDRLEHQGVSALSADERADWVHFLISLQMRQPNLMAITKAAGHAALVDSLMISDDAKAELKGFDLDGSLLPWLEAQAPGVADNFGLTLVPDVLTDPLRNAQFQASAWAVIDVGGLANDLMIGDAPSLLRGDVDTPEFIWMLPISPTKVFVLSPDPVIVARLAQVPRRQLITRLNSQTLFQARDRVFARGAGQQRFVAAQWAAPPRPAA